MFETEQEMSIKFEKYMKINYGNAYLKECQGLFGIPDFVFYNKKQQNISIVSFELKLKNWRKATKQAFRYKSFSNIAYVVLPEKTAKTAMKNVAMFKKYNIGLASFDLSSVLEILYKPELSHPYSDSLNLKLIEELKGSKKKSKNIETLFD